MKYTKEMILELAKEKEIEEKKTIKVPHYYKRNGMILERSYPDYIYTDRYRELTAYKSPLNTARVFVDKKTKKAYAYNDLEKWICDFEKDRYVSSEEYENYMGDDL